MKRGRRIYTDADKALMWDRWQRGDTLHAIAAGFDRYHSSVANVLAPGGGIRTPERRHSRLALIDTQTNQVVSAKSIQLSPKMLDCGATFVERLIQHNRIQAGKLGQYSVAGVYAEILARGAI
jgi:hypothetical protein